MVVAVWYTGNVLLSSITVKRCSSCRQVGHTKKTCTVSSATNETAVRIQTFGDASPSPHVIHLARGEEKHSFREMPVYEHTPESKSERQVVDFSALVQFANQNPEPPTPPPIRLRPISHRVPSVSLGTVLGMVCLLAAVVGLPFPVRAYYGRLKLATATVVEQSTAGFLALQSSTVAALASNLPQAESDLNHALSSFANAQSFLEKDHQLLVSVARWVPVLGVQVESRQALLSAGQSLALGNAYLLKGIGEAKENAAAPLTDRLAVIRNHVRGALPYYTEALESLDHVDPRAVPVEYQQSFQDFETLVGTFIGDMRDMVELADLMNTVFGDTSLKRYLIVFQNHHELRPTGGFMGSFALIDVEKGKILSVDVPGGGTYDLQGQLSEYVKPPLPLQLVNARWEFQDANWFPDFAASAQKMEWFYTHARDRSVDGVIAVNATVLERVLRVVGPIDNQEFGLLLDADNVLTKIQTQVEVGYDKTENKPKAVVASLLDQLVERMRHTETVDAVRLLSELHDALQEKEIQVYLNNQDVQKKVRTYGWTGELRATTLDQDYLGVIYANIGGQKSDARIKQAVSHQAVIQPDGSVVNTVIVRRTHNGTPEEGLYGATNIGYLRIYVPAGATLIDAGGFSYPPEDIFHVPEDWYKNDADLMKIEREESIQVKNGTRITSEFGKTVFGNWLATSPGDTSEVYFTYTLPFQVFIPGSLSVSTQDSLLSRWSPKKPSTSKYTLYLEKQSGISTDFTSQVIYPENWLPVWRSAEDIDLASNGASAEGVLSTNRVIGLLMQYMPST